MDYFFPLNELDCDVGACAGPLRCYQDGAISFKQGFFDCEELYTDLDEVQSNDNTFDLFPNPAADYLNIELKGFSGSDVLIRIFNNNSQLVSSGYYFVDQDIVTIDVNNLANNIYFIQVVSKDKVETKQFVKSN